MFTTTISNVLKLLFWVLATAGVFGGIAWRYYINPKMEQENYGYMKEFNQGYVFPMVASLYANKDSGKLCIHRKTVTRQPHTYLAKATEKLLNPPQPDWSKWQPKLDIRPPKFEPGEFYWAMEVYQRDDVEFRWCKNCGYEECRDTPINWSDWKTTREPLEGLKISSWVPEGVCWRVGKRRGKIHVQFEGCPEGTQNVFFGGFTLKEWDMRELQSSTCAYATAE